MANSLDSKGLFNFSLISAEIFPLLLDLQTDKTFFSAREQEILHYFLRKKTVKEISHATALAIMAVEHHIENIKIKMRLTASSSFVTQLASQFSTF